MLKPTPSPPSPATPPRKPRHSLEVFDRLLDRAFAPRGAPPPLVLSTAAVHEDDDDDGGGGDGGDAERATTAFYSPVEPDFPIALHDGSLDSVWEEVRSAKARELAGAPSKVRSLAGPSLGSQTAVQDAEGARRDSLEGAGAGAGGGSPGSPGRHGARRRVTRKRSSVSFRESPDGKNVLVTFEMAGVRKQDMHVSFRTNRLVVSWRLERTAERHEGGALVREREVRRFSHTLPLPEGTKFEEVRASRDGQRLTLTLPNSKCVRVGPDAEDADADEERPPSPEKMPDIDAALSMVTEFHSCYDRRP